MKLGSALRRYYFNFTKIDPEFTCTSGSIFLKAPAKGSMIIKFLILCIVFCTAGYADSRTARVGAVSMEKTHRFSKPLQVKIKEVLPLITEAGAEKLGLDLIVLPEYLFRGTYFKKGVQDLSNSIVLDSMKKAAKINQINIIFQIVEKEYDSFYNSVIVIDRKGNFVGKYRKVNLPPEEKWASPGVSFPVFNLDFGKVGVLICWDFWFTEPTKKLVEEGAELIVVPTWCNIKQNLQINSAQSGVPIVFSVLKSKTCTINGSEDVSSSIYDYQGTPSYQDHFVGENKIAVGEVIIGSNKNLALHKKIKTSADTVDGFSSENLVDGVFNSEKDASPGMQTSWKAISLPQWVEIDLGKNMDINRVSLALFGGEEYSFLIEGSSNSLNYDMLSDSLSHYETFIEHGIKGAEIYSTYIEEKSNTKAKKYRYIKITANSITKKEIIINEIKVFGKP